ncbi:MAG: SRPBCC family protein [Bacteroidota bacterium]
MLAIILPIIGAILASGVLYAWMLPPQWRVEERISIQAPQELLYDYVNFLPNWEQWTIWNKREDENFIFHYLGAESGVGAQQCWKNGKQYGSVKITDANSPEGINYILVFSHANSHMKGTFAFLPRGGTTEVVWCMYGDAGNSPYKKVLAKVLMGYVHRDCARGLKQLKKIMEADLAVSP